MSSHFLLYLICCRLFHSSKYTRVSSSLSSLFCEAGLVSEPGTHWLVRLAAQQTQGSFWLYLPSLGLQAWGGCQCLALIWMLGIWTQVQLLLQQMLWLLIQPPPPVLLISNLYSSLYTWIHIGISQFSVHLLQLLTFVNTQGRVSLYMMSVVFLIVWIKLGSFCRVLI